MSYSWDPTEHVMHVDTRGVLQTGGLRDTRASRLHELLPVGCYPLGNSSPCISLYCILLSLRRCYAPYIHSVHVCRTLCTAPRYWELHALSVCRYSWSTSDQELSTRSTGWLLPSGVTPSNQRSHSARYDVPAVHILQMHTVRTLVQGCQYYTLRVSLRVYVSLQPWILYVETCRPLVY